LGQERSSGGISAADTSILLGLGDTIALIALREV
jgi:hypothetical protein